MAAPTRAAARARLAALTALGLLAACVAWARLRSGTSAADLLFTLALLVPLAMPLPGLLRSRRRTFGWATLCVTPYFIYGSTETVANPSVRAIAGAILVCSLALFVALVAYLRLTRPQAAAQSS